MAIEGFQDTMSRPTATRYGFLVYDNRSGSTMAAALLNELRGVSVAQESQFVTNLLEYPWAIRNPRELDSLLDLLYREVQFQEMDIRRIDILARLDFANGEISKKAVIDAISDVYFQRRDPNAVLRVFKGGRAFFNIPQILQIYPSARFIHIVRDGRAVYASKKTSRSIDGSLMESNPLKSALDWRRRLGIAKKHGEVFCNLRYEELVLSTQQELLRFSTFFALSKEYQERTKTQEHYFSSIGSAQIHLHPNVAKPPDEERLSAWNAKLSDDEIRIFEIIAGAALKEMNYPLSDVRASSLIRTRVSDFMLYFKFGTRLALTRLHRIARFALTPDLFALRFRQKVKEWRS